MDIYECTNQRHHYRAFNAIRIDYYRFCPRTQPSVVLAKLQAAAPRDATTEPLHLTVIPRRELSAFDLCETQAFPLASISSRAFSDLLLFVFRVSRDDPALREEGISSSSSVSAV